MSVICRVILIEQLSLKLFWRRKWNHIKYCALKGKNLFAYLQDREYGVTKLWEIYISKPDNEKKENKVWPCHDFRFLAGNGNHYFFLVRHQGNNSRTSRGVSGPSEWGLLKCYIAFSPLILWSTFSQEFVAGTFIHNLSRVTKWLIHILYSRTENTKPPMASPRGRPLKGKARNRREKGESRRAYS